MVLHFAVKIWISLPPIPIIQLILPTNILKEILFKNYYSLWIQVFKVLENSCLLITFSSFCPSFLKFIICMLFWFSFLRFQFFYEMFLITFLFELPLWILSVHSQFHSDDFSYVKHRPWVFIYNNVLSFFFFLS